MKIYNGFDGCKCLCHYGHNIMHCIPCCGPGSVEIEDHFTGDLSNPRLQELGYQW